MSMPDAVKGGDHTTLTITWLTANGNVYDLSSADSVTARIESPAGIGRAATGTLTVTDGSNGIFTYQPSAADVREAGDHYIQFKANYGDGTADLTEKQAWTVLEAI